MSDFPGSMGNLPVGGKRKIYNLPTIRSSSVSKTLMDQYEEETDPEKKHDIFLRIQGDHQRKLQADRLMIC